MRALPVILLCLITISDVLAGPADPLPGEWKPDLRLVEEVVTRFYENGGQQGLNLRTGRVFEIRDAELAILYLRLYCILPSKEQALLRNEQAKWLKYRAAEVDKVAPNDESRGTIAPMEENDRAIELTEARLKVLQARLEKLR